jgi:glycosyltransferase involved in cell wall biosynthesis
VPNFVVPADGAASRQELPGVPGQRIVCIANLRPQKDHLNLIRAMAIVQKDCPSAHLLLVGGESDPVHAKALRDEVTRLHLQDNISFLGQVERASSILSGCDIGVLSSVSEGLPLSLLEYGWANLPSIATSVGQCAQVLNNGDAGILVEPQDSGQLAAAMLRLLQSSEECKNYGTRFGAFVRKQFHPETILDQICGIYEQVVSGN